MNVQTIALDLNKGNRDAGILRIGQRDKNAPILQAAITDHGALFDLANYAVRFKMRKPSGGVYEVEGTTDGNVATFSLDGMEPGISEIAYVQISNENTVASTQRVRVEVLEGICK